ncbi:MAG: helix-hairpin-helix domain-containing protein [Marivita lacus]|nr:helix-hairpin-helix domain-containing protein [Marivita lacus]
MTRLTDIHGIGPALAKRLEAAGIVDGKTLAKADTAVLTAIPGVSASRAAAWQETAAGNAPTASSDIQADQPDTTLVVLAVPSADAAPVEDAPVEAAKPKAKAKAEKKPAKGKKKDEKAKTKKAGKPAKAKKAEKSQKADADVKKTGKTKKTASDKKKSADKGKAEKTKKTKAKSKKKVKAA